jgi:hypothetical protein
LLLERGANPNGIKGDHYAPLWKLPDEEDTERMEILLQAGANPNVERLYCSPLDVANARKQPKVARLLARYGGKPSDKLERFGLADEKAHYVETASRPTKDIFVDARNFMARMVKRFNQKDKPE